jgi:5-methyltetrahydrofolate--homocysteine methyltransferase
VGLSALLTTTMTHMRRTTALIKGRFPGTRVIVGGAPVTAGFAAEIGADAYAPDGAQAVEVLKALVST